jgi:exosortase B
MSSVLPRPLFNAANAPWLLAAAGLAAMYLPSYWAAMNGLWRSDDFGHAPIILVIAIWLFWQVRAEVWHAPDQTASTSAAWALLVLGLVLYVFGRVFTVSSVEFFSQPLMVAAVLLLLKGPAALRAAWFPVLYLIFMVPLPGTLVDAVTGPLKQWISYLVVNLLYAAGYPIARTGVMITIGPYQLLVADACSGLHSMFSLSALGTLFMYIMGRASRWHNAVMLAAILPIAFGANIVRVMVLVLVTYHLGDEAGQGFLHGAAGIVLLLVALVLLFLLDTLLAATFKRRAAALS